MAARIQREGDKLVVNLSNLGKTAFDEKKALLKSIEGYRWNPDTKLWEFPAEPMIAHRIIHQVGLDPAADVLEWVRQELAKQADEVTTKLPSVSVTSLSWENRNGLYEHQVDAIDFLARHPRAILADDMGLGKTIEAIGTVEERIAREVARAYDYAGRHGLPLPSPLVDQRPKLVVAPATMAGKWAEEIEKWGSGPVFLIPGKMAPLKRRALLEKAIRAPGAWIVTTWEQIRAQRVALDKETRKELIALARERGDLAEVRRLYGVKYRRILKEPLYGQVEWAAVIADEAHRAKNRDAQQTRGLWQLRGEVRLALTGTPVLNSPDEIWPLLVWVAPETYGEYREDLIGYSHFYDQYVEYSEGQFGKIVTGVKNADALRFSLADKLVRRTKGQVLDLPEKVRTTIPLAMSPAQRALYEDAERGLWFEIELALKGEHADQVRAALERNDLERVLILVPNAAARHVRLRQLLETPALFGGKDDSVKLDYVVETIGDHPGHPFVVFTHFRGTTAVIKERLERSIKPLQGRVATLTGETPPEQRTALVSAFQAGDLDVLAMPIAAGGVGLTLTRADTAIFVSRETTPGYNEQAEDRLHRIGQQNSVSILIPEAVDTLDTQTVAERLQTKGLIVSSIVTQDPVTHLRKEAA
jgi:SNF2 family DNA or RNA helicase